MNSMRAENVRVNRSWRIQWSRKLHVDTKPQIDTLLSRQLTQGPQKVQLCARLRLIKVLYDEPDIPEDDCIEKYANSLMTSVYANGISDEAYWQMVEKMMNVLATFNSLGSVWTLENVLQVDVKLARFRQFPVSSYIALPSKTSNCRGLLNVRNHEDWDCFSYCFVAVYHMYQHISLDRIDRNYQTDKHSPTTYNQSRLHQTLDDFIMPMGSADNPQFETLNNVQVNVFGYDNGLFFPLKILSYTPDFLVCIYFCCMTVTITTKSSLQTIWRWFATCEDLIIDSPTNFAETAFGFFENVLKLITYISVKVANMCLLSFIYLQVRTTHTISRTWLLRGLSLLFFILTATRSYYLCLLARDKVINYLHKSSRYMSRVALR